MKAEVMKREAQLKTGNGRKYIWAMIRQKFVSTDGQSVGFVSLAGGLQFDPAPRYLESHLLVAFFTSTRLILTA